MFANIAYRIVSYDERMINMVQNDLTNSEVNAGARYRDCDCAQQKRPCYACEYQEVQRRPIQLASDCIVVDSLICSRKINPVAELIIPIPTLGDIIDIGPGGVISPLVTLTPNINGIIFQTTVTKDLIVITGFLPASITILGIETPLNINIPFQEEINCPGICPEDTISPPTFTISSVITQGIEALGITVANILFKVVLSAQVTVTRPIIAKANDLRIVGDVNINRCCQGSGTNG